MRQEDMDLIKQMAEIIGIAVRAGVEAERKKTDQLMSDLKVFLEDTDLPDLKDRVENALMTIRLYERGAIDEIETGPAVGNEFPNGYDAENIVRI